MPDHVTVQKAPAKDVRAMTIMQGATVVPPPTARMPHAAMAVVAIRVHPHVITAPRNQAQAGFVAT